MNIQCCVCKRVKENGQWQHATGTAHSHYSHSYCPECLREALLLSKTSAPAPLAVRA